MFHLSKKFAACHIIRIEINSFPYYTYVAWSTIILLFCIHPGPPSGLFSHSFRVSHFVRVSYVLLEFAVFWEWLRCRSLLRFKLKLCSRELFQNFVTRRQLPESCYASFDLLIQITKAVLPRGVTARETWAYSWEPKTCQRNKCSGNIRVFPTHRNLTWRNELNFAYEATKSVGSSVSARQALQWKMYMNVKQLRIKYHKNFPSALHNAPSDPGKCGAAAVRHTAAYPLVCTWPQVKNIWCSASCGISWQ